MLVDSGRQVAASVFFVVPPNDSDVEIPYKGRLLKIAGKKIVFDEIYLRSASALSWAELAAPKIRGRNYVAWLIDHLGGRQADIGSGKTVEDQYRDALVAQGVTSRYGNSFLWGSTDVPGRISKFRSWLEPSKIDAEPTFLYFKDICRWIKWEFDRYHNEKKKGELIDKPVKKHDHLMDCLGYAAMHGLAYQTPPALEVYSGGAQSFIKKWISKARHGDANYISLG
jgi:hypothetical protein